MLIEEERFNMRKISVLAAAKVMKKHPTFVRQALSLGLLPFGVAMPSKTGRRQQFFINEKDFIQYTGCTPEEIDAAEAEIKAKQKADAAKYKARAAARAGK